MRSWPFSQKIVDTAIFIASSISFVYSFTAPILTLRSTLALTIESGGLRPIPYGLLGAPINPSGRTKSMKNDEGRKEGGGERGW